MFFFLDRFIGGVLAILIGRRWVAGVRFVTWFYRVFFLVFLKLAGSTFLKKNLSSSSFYTQTAERNSVNSVSISINLKKNESKRVCKDNHFTLFDQEQPGTIQIEKKTYLFNEQEIISVKPSKQ